MSFLCHVWMDFIVLVSIASLLFYIVVKQHYAYWKRRGVYSPKVSFPGGHLGDVLIGKSQLGVKFTEIYEKNKHRPFIGIFLFHAKAMLIQDMDLIKNVLIKDFQHFPGHGLGYDSTIDPLSKHLFNMEGNEWKELRNKLTQTFTSNKMRYMFDTLLKCSKVLEDYLDGEMALGNDVDFKETLAKYGTDVIGSCAFGIETNSFKYPDAEFRQMGKKIFKTNFTKAFRETLSLYAPSLVSKFGIRIVSKELEDFFVATVKRTVKYREDNKVSRNDFLQLLIELKNTEDESGSDKGMNITEITAQSYLFFLAGFETSSTTASFALYELAKNPHIQDKLRKNIDDVIKKYDGKLNYDAIIEMSYLTQVIEETLRMYPPLPFLFRNCPKDYPIPGTDTVIESGTIILIPIMGIQRDHNIHESPMEFRPERFSPENKRKIHQFSAIPFGEGPRMCIGNRFGLMQTRLGIISVISKHEVSVCKKTLIPMVFESGSISLMAKDLYLRITPRKDK